MTVVFDGKAYSDKKKKLLETSVSLLNEQGIVPHLATIMFGENDASLQYINSLKKFLESLGCQIDIYNLPRSVKQSDAELLIKTLNEDTTVHGVIVLKPSPFSLENSITPLKDIDGSQENSNYLHPTAKAVLEILAIGILETKIDVVTVCVVGASGMVGGSLVREFKKLGYIVLEADNKTDSQTLQSLTLQSDVVVSSTGVANLITQDMVNETSIVIDVGTPQGDVSSDVYQKVSLVTPVPGGVGPVTITCLAENLIIASSKN